MIRYTEDVLKMVTKGLIPQDVFANINNAFMEIDIKKDLNLFDIKPFKETSGVYYRLRKGKYRAIFYIDNDDIMVITIDKREDVYRKWR